MFAEPLAETLRLRREQPFDALAQFAFPPRALSEIGSHERSLQKCPELSGARALSAALHHLPF
jgi:hypothetical protein